MFQIQQSKKLFQVPFRPRTFVHFIAWEISSGLFNITRLFHFKWKVRYLHSIRFFMYPFVAVIPVIKRIDKDEGKWQLMQPSRTIQPVVKTGNIAHHANNRFDSLSTKCIVETRHRAAWCEIHFIYTGPERMSGPAVIIPENISTDSNIVQSNQYRQRNAKLRTIHRYGLQIEQSHTL